MKKTSRVRLLTLGIITGTLFAIILWDMLTHGFMAQLDMNILQKILTLRTSQLTNIAIACTWLANWQTIIPLTILVTAYLWYAKKHRTAQFFMGTLIIGEAIGELLKWLVHRQRPEEIFALVSRIDYSFPSAHALMATLFYGMIAYMITRHIKSLWGKWIVSIIATCIMVGVGLSRVYLGVHWASDVVAGWLAGGAILIYTYCRISKK